MAHSLGLNKQALVVLLGLALVLGTLSGVAPTSAQESMNWQVVDEDGLSGEVMRWVEANRHVHGIHVLPAGDMRYLLVSWGEKPTGGYVMDVKDVAAGEEHAPGVIRISVELIAPGPDDNVTQALTYPYLLIELPAGDETLLVNFHGAGWHEGMLGAPAEDDPAIILEAVTAENNLAPNPLVVRGRARVFEGMMILVIEDGHNQLRNHCLSLSAGGPEWAQFEVALTYPDPTNPYGAVIGSYEDPRDGSLVEVAIEPLAFGSISSRLPDADGHWAEASIRQGVLAGFIDGYPDGTLGPERTVTRAEFLKMLVAGVNAGQRTHDSSVEFEDVQGHWVESELSWAVEEGWVSIEEDGSLFRPDDVLSREIMARWAARAAGLSPVEGETSFADETDIDQALMPWVAAAAEAGLLLGYPDGTFRPDDSLKRSEAVTVVLRALELREN